jgi:hypothetical protein
VRSGTPLSYGHESVAGMAEGSATPPRIRTATLLARFPCKCPCNGQSRFSLSHPATLPRVANA